MSDQRRGQCGVAVSLPQASSYSENAIWAGIIFFLSTDLDMCKTRYECMERDTFCKKSTQMRACVEEL